MKKHLTVSLLVAFLCFCTVVVQSAVAQQPDRTKPPKLGPPPTLKLPPLQRFTLSNGLPVLLMEKHQVPVVQINLLVRVGSAMDPGDRRGLASLTAAMMEEGAGERDALAFADAVDFLGATINVSAGVHTTTVSLFTPLSKLDSSLALFADVIARPRFAAEELERKRIERLTTLQQWHDEPRIIASQLFNKVLFGEQHPYGLPTIGNEQALRAFTVQDLRTFYATYFSPRNATLVVVGDVVPAVLHAKLEEHLASWKGDAVFTPSFQPAPQVPARKVFVVDKPGAPQTVIRIGRIGAARTTPDYYAITVMNTILGGSFTSRLNNNLREEHGYTYGAGSRFTLLPLPGPFLAFADVHAEVTDKALAEFMKELRTIASVTEEEVQRAKNYVALSYPSQFQSVGDIAGALAEVVLYNLPDDYFNSYTSNILAVTKKDVERVARTYIDPDRIVIVMVGDRNKIEQGIAALRLGQIAFLTIEDVLGKPPVIEKQ